MSHILLAVVGTWHFPSNDLGHHLWWPSFFPVANTSSLYDHAQGGRAMIQRESLELLLAAVAGAGLGGVTGLVLGHEELGTLIFALVGAVVVSGVVYLYRSFVR
jgi:hypothetical protein